MWKNKRNNLKKMRILSIKNKVRVAQETAKYRMYIWCNTKQEITNQIKIAEIFNDYFSTIGMKVKENIHKNNNNSPEINVNNKAVTNSLF